MVSNTLPDTMNTSMVMNTPKNTQGTLLSKRGGGLGDYDGVKHAKYLGLIERGEIILEYLV